jgi:hypothetical protein
MERKNSLAYTASENTHTPIFNALNQWMSTGFRVQAKFTYLGFNGHRICVGDRCLVRANSKFDKLLKLGDGVILLAKKGVQPCGSNKYPHIAWEEGATCTLEFISDGLPLVDRIKGWHMHIESITPIT